MGARVQEDLEGGRGKRRWLYTQALGPYLQSSSAPIGQFIRAPQQLASIDIGTTQLAMHVPGPVQQQSDSTNIHSVIEWNGRQDAVSSL